MLELSTETKVHDKIPNVTSLMEFKILLILTYYNSIYFEKLKGFLERSKSQVSVSLRKMKIKRLIKTDNKRPMKVSITKIGRSAKSRIIKDMVKFKNNKDKKEKKIIKKISPSAIEKNIIRNLNLRNQSHKNLNNKNFDLHAINSEIDEDSKVILMSFFIELPEILLDIDTNLTINQYEKFREAIKKFLSRYNLKI